MAKFRLSDEPAPQPAQRFTPVDHYDVGSPAPDNVHQDRDHGPAVLGWIIAALTILLLALIVTAGLVLAGVFDSPEVAEIDGLAYEVDAQVVEAVRTYKERKNFIQAEQFREGARLYDAGKIKTLADFEDWLKTQAADPDNPHKANRVENYQPLLDSINQPEGNPRIPIVFRSIAEGWQD